MNRAKYARGAILRENIGHPPCHTFFYRIMSREGDWVVVKKLETITKDGIPFPGRADPYTSSFRRKIKKSEGREYGFPIFHADFNYAGWAMSPERRGGKRKGAGRPPGTIKGRKAVSVTLSMTKQQWAEIDAMRGKIPRGKYLAKMHHEIFLKNMLQPLSDCVLSLSTKGGSGIASDGICHE